MENKNYVVLSPDNLLEIVDKATDILSDGGIVIAPFDTVYGFLADAKNGGALKKIYALKGRSFDKPFGVVVPRRLPIEKWVDIPEYAQSFIDERTPGRFTFIVKVKNSGFVSEYCLKNGTVALRIPDSELIHGISCAFGRPLAQTSANKAGKSDVSNPGELGTQFSPEDLASVNLIIDGGKIEDAAPSKIFDLTGEKAKEIERK